jgi:hypothetical protein
MSMPPESGTRLPAVSVVIAAFAAIEAAKPAAIDPAPAMVP